MARIVLRNFTGGEVTPTLATRYDLQKSGTFMSVCENFLPNLHGDIERRPGTRHCANVNSDAFLVPFQFNMEPINTYVLIFRNKLIAFADSYGNMKGYTVASPYTVAEAREASMSQVGDVIYIAHKNHALHKLMRTGHVWDPTWKLEEVDLNASLPKPNQPRGSWNRGQDSEGKYYDKNETYWLLYRVSAVDANGTESLASMSVGVHGRYPSDWVAGDYVSINWDWVDGATEYNIYRDSGGYFGWIGTATENNFTDNNYEPDTSRTPKDDWNPFAYGNNPSIVTFHQQRMVLAGTADNPATFYMSRTGDFENFRKSRPMQDDDPIEYMLASGSIDEIAWMTSFGDLLIGTAGAEYKARSSGSAITYSDIALTCQSYWGSAALPPLIIGNSILHCQRTGAHVRDLTYSLEKDGYAGNDMSVLSPQLVEGHTIKQWAFQQSPGSRLWCVRDDGVLLCLTYMKEQNIFGWSVHRTQGKYLSVCSVCSGGEDVVFVLVERSNRITLERFAPNFKDSDTIEDAFFVDNGRTLTFAEPVEEVDASWLPNGTVVSVLADGAEEAGHVVTEGKVKLYQPAKKITVGYSYSSVFCPLPVDADVDGLGTTVGRKRGYGRCGLRVYRTVGGEYAHTYPGDLYDRDSWKGREFYSIPHLPAKYGEPCEPFSGTVDITLASGLDADTSVFIKQSSPYPFRLIAVTADMDIAEV